MICATWPTPRIWPARSAGSASCLTPEPPVGLVRRLGHAWAFEVATSARTIGATEARGTRLVNAVFARECLIEEELQRAETLAAGPTEAFALTEQLMVQAEREDEFAVLEREAHAQGIAATSDDHRKAVAAFLAKTGRP